MKTAIVGGGAAGLSLALMLKGDVTVFEREKHSGGLCRSIAALGHTLDQGPHILGGIETAVTWIREHTSIEWVEGTVNNRTLIDGMLCPHPMTDEADVVRYMRKQWKTEPDQLDLGGLSAQRGRKPGGVSRFFYPKSGGYQSITDSWAEQLGGRLVLSRSVSVDELRGEYDRIVWTAPVPHLRYNHLVVTTVLFFGESPDLTAIYLPEERWIHHRLSFPAIIAQRDGYAMQGEASFTEGIPAGVVEEMFELRELLGLGTKGAALSQVVRNAYPVPVGHEPPKNDVIYHGRSGSHRYLNLDGVVAQSMELAERLNACES